MPIVSPQIKQGKKNRKDFIEYLTSLIPATQMPNPPGMPYATPATWQDTGRGILDFLVPQPEDTLMGLGEYQLLGMQKKPMSKPDTDAMVEIVEINKLKPTQYGDDLYNDTSRGYAHGYLGGSKGDVGPLTDYRQLPPIIVDSKMNIIDGNMRYAAANLAGLNKMKVIVINQK